MATRLASCVTPRGDGIPNRVKYHVRKRDGSQCQFCLDAEQPTSVHHLDWPYCRSHDLLNLVTLCQRCHQLVHALRVNLTWALLDRAVRTALGQESPPATYGAVPLDPDWWHD